MTGYGKLEKFLSHIEWILSKLYWNIQANPSNNKQKLEFTLAILLNAHFVTFQYLQKDSIKSLPEITNLPKLKSTEDDCYTLSLFTACIN